MWEKKLKKKSSAMKTIMKIMKMKIKIKMKINENEKINKNILS